MRCRGLALLLLVGAAAAEGADADSRAAPPYADLATLQIMQFGNDAAVRDPPYRLSLSLVPPRPSNGEPFAPGFAAANIYAPIVAPQIPAASSDNRFSGSTSWSPLLRLDTKGERLELKPRRHSLSLQWNKSFP